MKCVRGKVWEEDGKEAIFDYEGERGFGGDHGVGRGTMLGQAGDHVGSGRGPCWVRQGTMLGQAGDHVG